MNNIDVNKINKGQDLNTIINLVLNFNIDNYILPTGNTAKERYHKLLQNNDIKIIYDISKVIINKKLLKEYYSIPRVEIQIINDSLKSILDHNFIQKHHTKEYWIQKMIFLIKEKSINITYNINKAIDYDPKYESCRCGFDNRVLYIRNQFIMKYLIPIEINQICSLTTEESIFTDLLGNIPRYNKSKDLKGNEIYVVLDIYGFPSYLFEDNSFFDYFTNRNKKIDDILN